MSMSCKSTIIFTGLVLMTLENFGFCGRGEAGPFATAGNLRWLTGDSRSTLRADISLKRIFTALNLAVEGVRQLRGEF
jgi:hypothetical protein